MSVDREQAIRAVLAMDVPGSGPLELVRREAEAIVDTVLALPDPEVERLRGALQRIASGDLIRSLEDERHRVAYHRCVDVARAALSVSESEDA